MDLDPVRLRLLQLVQEQKTDLKNLSLAIGRNAAYLHQFVFRGTPKILAEDVRQALAEHLAVEEDELRHSQIPTRKPRSPNQRDDVGLALPDGFLPVSEIDVRASAGYGAVHDGLEETKATWLFPDAVVRYEFRAQPSDLRMITITGDSMEPLLSSGDRILIDTSQKVPVPPGIFVIWDGMGLVTKRIEHIPHSDPPTVVIRSINPEYQTYERTADEVNIIGRVIWAAKQF
ncbi:putative repressor protein CI [Magnetospirillum gryphiswaldense MSR-1 v2]|uniref:Repressor protein CI n=1 Tax=Magnetospirillum gryphiswaldense (strain DSM 6361 / JCM 21280 / NBRC 15271 / MSR-1) TaxID=431944 RepID=V6EXS4_MAGGM|nr:LexA family transcriptional regulator [Magnetospirillum gryphiswaldense]CDK97927.1 putative repressor protein CI [Magnetospirillum gryphiswaldense MSR-1 v2]